MLVSIVVMTFMAAMIVMFVVTMIVVMGHMGHMAFGFVAFDQDIYPALFQKNACSLGRRNNTSRRRVRPSIQPLQFPLPYDKLDPLLSS